MKLKDPSYKEQSRELILSKFEHGLVLFNLETLFWFARTTTDKDGNEISNYMFYYDFLCRMQSSQHSDLSFRRPMVVELGQFQYSEEKLAIDWNISRRHVRDIIATMRRLDLIATKVTRTASIATICNTYLKIKHYFDYTSYSEFEHKFNPILKDIRDI